MALRQISDPSQFGSAKTWDLRDVVSGTLVPPGFGVGALPEPFYALDGGIGLFINDDGPVVNCRTCSDIDCRCGFWDGDAVLVAVDPAPSADATEAPLRVRFAQGIRALGAWIGVTPADALDASFFDAQPMWGHVWVELASDPGSLHLFTAAGTTGSVLQHGMPLSAPFVGVRTTGGDRIVEARFDASLMGNRQFRELVLSELSYTV